MTIAMTIPETLPIAIAELGATLNLPALALDEGGYASLQFDEKLLVQIQYQPAEDGLLLFSHLGPAPAEARHRAEVYGQLLRANFLWEETRGATLSLHGDLHPAVVLARQIPAAALTGSDLNAVLQSFVKAGLAWMEYLAEPDGAAADGEEEIAPHRLSAGEGIAPTCTGEPDCPCPVCAMRAFANRA